MKVTITNDKPVTRNIPIPGYLSVTIKPFQTILLNDADLTNREFYDRLALAQNGLSVQINNKQADPDEETPLLPPWTNVIPDGYQDLPDDGGNTTPVDYTKYIKSASDAATQVASYYKTASDAVAALSSLDVNAKADTTKLSNYAKTDSALSSSLSDLNSASSKLSTDKNSLSTNNASATSYSTAVTSAATANDESAASQAASNAGTNLTSAKSLYDDVNSANAVVASAASAAYSDYLADDAKSQSDSIAASQASAATSQATIAHAYYKSVTDSVTAINSADSAVSSQASSAASAAGQYLQSADSQDMGEIVASASALNTSAASLATSAGETDSQATSADTAHDVNAATSASASLSSMSSQATVLASDANDYKGLMSAAASDAVKNAQSAEAVATTVPGAPTLQATAGDAKALVTLVDGENKGTAVTDRVVYWTDGTNTGTTDLKTSLTGEVDGLTNGTEYSLQATTKNSAGESAKSAVVKVTPKAAS